MFAFFSANGLQKLGRTLFRPLGAWVGFTGLYVLVGGACPCCGLPACPISFAGAGVVGGLLTAGLHLWRRLAAPPDTLAPPQTLTTHEEIK